MLKKVETFRVLLGILVLCLLGVPFQSEAGADIAAPSFSLPDLNGKEVTLEQYRGKIVLLDFWATWCPPCRISIPELVKLQRDHQEDGLVILGVSVDDKRQFKDAYLKAFSEKHKINYPIVRYNDRVIEAYFTEDNPAIPTMFVIDRNGRIRDKVVGYNPEALRRALKPLLEP
ncbi:peroxiredoxin family protein [Desulfatiglans anilini]|uniref:peroxiredoxin family protein n=1 Tax=Desulfatiglans anilini TaxID=90728 RepID=UPI00042553A3|nr:TlpA disulfide reductase family protein [Desulfatiglans anilini]